jgi:hypothetical protein
MARRKASNIWLEKKALRSRERREAKSLHIVVSESVEDFPISKGGRCGRRKLDAVIQAVKAGNEAEIRQVLQDFTKVPQPR